MPYRGKPRHNLPWSSGCMAKLIASEPAVPGKYQYDCWIGQQNHGFLLPRNLTRWLIQDNKIFNSSFSKSGYLLGKHLRPGYYNNIMNLPLQISGHQSRG